MKSSKNSNGVSIVVTAIVAIAITTLLIVPTMIILTKGRTNTPTQETTPIGGSMIMVNPDLNPTNGVQVIGFNPSDQVSVKVTFNIAEAIAQERAMLEDYRKNKTN
jgi:hypothetical protein